MRDAGIHRLAALGAHVHGGILCGKIAITVGQECYRKGVQGLLTCSLDCNNRKDDDHGDPNVPRKRPNLDTPL